MKFYLYCIFDNLSDHFFPPFLACNDELAKRFLRDELAITDSMLKRYPNDFGLYRVGTFKDPEEKIVSPLSDPCLFFVGRVSEILDVNHAG